jgi:hypothetical protein
MKAKRYPATGVSLLALALAIASIASAAGAHAVYYPYKMGTGPIDPNTPLIHVGPHQVPYVAPPGAKSGTWTDVPNLPFTKVPWGEMLMTDGTVIIEDYCTSPAQWYKLAPDSKGRYTDGTWSAIAPMPSGYSPLFFAQQVLPSGNVIVNGGQYNDCKLNFSDKGALYDYRSNSWTSVSPPSGWSEIGGAESIILPDGTYMLASCCFFEIGEQALASISGTNVTWTTSQTWDCYNPEGACMSGEGFTPLPGGDVLLVDVFDHTSTSDEVRIYDTLAGTWSEAGNTADYLSSESDFDIGPAPLTPQFGSQGTIIQFTANTTLGVNDVYSVANGTWSSGPVMKVGSTIYDCAQASAVTLPDGNILVQASPGTYESPSAFWEWNISSTGAVTATQVNSTNTADDTFSAESNLLMLPTGQVLWDNRKARRTARGCR